MEINGKKIRPRVMHGLLAALLVIGGGLLLLVPGLKPDAAADPPPTTQAPGPGDGCGSQVHFFAADTTKHKFGPAAPEDLAGARAELGNRLCQDPALVVALSEYVQCKFSTPDERVAKTVDAIKVPGAWAMHVNAVLTAVDAGNPRIAPGSGSYKTMYMVSEGRLIPEVFATSPDRLNWQELEFDTPCGVKSLKLDCGFQPVEQTFPPTIPGKPGKPSKQQPPKVPAPPRTAPPATQPPSTTPPPPGQPPTTTPSTPSTQPPTTQPPPSTPKCQTTGTCGTPDSGPEFIPPQANDPALVAPTPGYTPGRAETVIPAQTPKPGADPYKPTPVGTQGTGAGGQTPVGQTDTPSGPVNGGSAGASNGATNNTSNQTSNGTVAPPP